MAGTDLEKVVRLENGGVIASTRDISEAFGKRHDHVLASVEAIMRQASSPENSGLGQYQLVSHWFRRESYLDTNGRPRPFFELTREGFTLLAVGFTGAKAQEFKVRLICRYEELEAQVRAAALPRPEDAILTQGGRKIIGGIVASVTHAHNKALRAAFDQALGQLTERVAALETPAAGKYRTAREALRRRPSW
jgi:Rha family phage regulatory protein